MTDYNSLITQAQQQGQARQTDYTNKANDYRNQYNTAKNQAGTAQQQTQQFSDYMKNEGSASNLYNTALTSQEQKTGYDQGQMQNAMRSLSQSQGSLSAYNDYANTAASKWGLNAGGLASANAGAQQGINNNIAAASQGLSNQQQAYQLAQTGANQEAGLGVQQQQTQLATYQAVYDQATTQQKMASDNMQAYEKMAQDQGGLTAQQTEMYQNSAKLVADAQNAMAQASAAIAASKLSIAQAQGQDIMNSQNQAYTNSKAYKAYLAGTTDKNGTKINQTTPAPSNSNAFSQGVDWIYNNLDKKSITNWADNNINKPMGSLFGIK